MPDLGRQGSEAVLIQHCPHYPDGQSQASERRFASKKCEKSGLAHNSSPILQTVIDKVQRIVQPQNISAQDLISLYHLQRFADQDSLPLSKIFHAYFKEKSSLFAKNPMQLKELATFLPCCVSTARFEEDIKDLMGPDITDPQVSTILNNKKEQIQRYEDLQKAIVKRRAELADYRLSHPSQYPSYLDVLLDKGYLYLYDHLLAMKKFVTRNERVEKIKEISFSELSHIILEVRKTIIQKVASAIPSGCKDVMFLLGETGSGKSTSLCFLRGDTMTLREDHTYASVNDTHHLIGHEATSCTFLPTIEIIKGSQLLNNL